MERYCSTGQSPQRAVAPTEEEEEEEEEEEVMFPICYQTVNVTSMTNTFCCEYSIKTPDDGQWTCPKHVEFFIKINLRNTASCWRLL